MEGLSLVRCRDDQDVPDTREDEGGQGVVDHRLVIDGHELLARPQRDGMQPGPSTAGQDDSAHVFTIDGGHCRPHRWTSATSTARRSFHR